MLKSHIIRLPIKLKGKNRILAVLALSLGSTILAGCTPSKADTVSDNISTAADNFEINRRVTFINGITDGTPLIIEGRCSIEADVEDNQLEVTCKTGPRNYKKHFLGLSDNMSYVVEQLEGADVDEFHHRVILRPEGLVPDFELSTSGRDSSAAEAPAEGGN